MRSEWRPGSIRLGSWFVYAYFGATIAATWVYFLNPDAAADQSIDGIFLRVGVAMTILPLVMLIYKSYLVYPARIGHLNKELPVIKYIPWIAAFSFLMGIVNQNGLLFALGDTYRITTLFLGVIAGLALPFFPLMRIVLITSVLYNILFVAGFAYAQYNGINVFVGMGTFHLLIPICMLPVLSVDATFKRALVIVLTLIALILGLKRSTILILPLLLMFLAASDRTLRIILVVIAALAFAGVLVYGEEIQPLVSVYDRVAETYDNGRIDTSSGSRVQEVVSAWNHLTKEAALGPMQFALLGLGSGATYPMDSDDLRLNTIADESIEIHNIHFTPMTLVFRHGIVPAAIILFAYASCLLCAWRTHRKGIGPEIRGGAASVFLLGIVLALVSVSGFTIVGDLLFPLLVGALIGARLDLRSHVELEGRQLAS
jgi:hypothetical protein